MVPQDGRPWLNASNLARAIKAVRHAVSDDDKRPILNAVLFDGDETGLRLIASDNYRLAMAVVDTGDWSALGKRPVMLAQVRLIQSCLVGSDYAEIEATDRPRPKMTVTTDYASVAVVVSDTPYPNWRKITTELAKPKHTPLTISPVYLHEALRAAEGFLGWGAVRVEVGGRLDAVIVSGGVDQPYSEWVMPVRPSS